MFSEVAAMAARCGSNDRADIAARRLTLRRATLRRWFGCLAALRRAEDGISAVEFALSAPPILLGLVLPVIDLGQGFSDQIRINNAVQAGAQYASANTWNSNSATEIQNVVQGAVPPSFSLSSVTATQQCGCPTASGSPSLFAIPAAPSTCASTTCSADGQPAGYYVQVSANVTYTPIVPYSVLTGTGSTTTLSSTATVRIY
jgi:Flp pilus assembly protein TadG